jgi:hypothetical protein
MVMGEEPRTVKEVQESEPAQEAVVVEIPYTPAPPFETRSCEVVGWLVVASPVQVSDESDPPTRYPQPDPANGPENESDEVAIEPSFAGVPALVDQKGIWPAVSADDVARYDASEIEPPVPICVKLPVNPVPAERVEVETP